MAKRWRCFYCDEVFITRRDAWLHFGEEGCESDIPACVDPLRTNEKARMKEVREAREHARKIMEGAEEHHDAHSDLMAMFSELRKYFGSDCNSVWLAGDRYKSALNRLADLEAQRAKA